MSQTAGSCFLLRRGACRYIDEANTQNRTASSPPTPEELGHRTRFTAMVMNLLLTPTTVYAVALMRNGQEGHASAAADPKGQRVFPEGDGQAQHRQEGKRVVVQHGCGDADALVMQNHLPQRHLSHDAHEVERHPEVGLKARHVKLPIGLHVGQGADDQQEQRRRGSPAGHVSAHEVVVQAGDCQWRAGAKHNDRLHIGGLESAHVGVHARDEEPHIQEIQPHHSPRPRDGFEAEAPQLAGQTHRYAGEQQLDANHEARRVHVLHKRLVHQQHGA
eukprot:scaffold7039_cov255-Pinguiococcus_pyrenoidosus.AAC.16